MPTKEGNVMKRAYTNRSVKDVCVEDFSMTPLEYVIEYCLHGWDMTVEQLCFELYGQEKEDNIEWIEGQVQDHLAEHHGYNM